MMNIDHMIWTLGVKTQSEDDITLCYKMDIEAFNMMKTPENDYEKEKKIFTEIYKYLMHVLYKHTLSDKEKAQIEADLADVDMKDEDAEFRNIYFHGLERTLLRFGRYDLILVSNRDARHKQAYMQEMLGNYDEAIRMYEHLGDKDRVLICNCKKNK